MSYLGDKLKGFFLFDEPEKNERFILKYPADNDKKDNGEKNRMEREIEKKLAEAGKKPEPSDAISDDIDVNMEFMKRKYSVPVNSDIVLREFSVNYRGDLIRAFIMFFDGMAAREIIDNYMLTPLMVNSLMNLESDSKEGLKDYISRQLLPHNQIKLESAYSKVIDEINFGGCALFVNGLPIAFSADVKGWEHRGVEKPNIEIVIRGPQEAFNELLRTCTAQVRKRVKDENLIVEDIIVGKVSKTPCCLLYIKNVTNDGLVDEVKRRLDSIRVDYMLDSGILEQLIEDSTIYPSPQVISTERPDYVSELLVAGRVAIIVNGSPNVLVVPITMFDLMRSAEDAYIRYPYVNMLRFIRYTALTFALLLPGVYLAIITYHQEMIPTDLLLAIEASREKVPFPAIIEILLMELSFELIREAGIRVPGPIGPTLGIIGALILGQAAVAANIVSPILIIIVAVTGIGSFAIPNFSQAYSVRILRFAFIFFGGLAGFLGITLGLFILGMWSASLKTFGVPFMAPLGPKTAKRFNNVIFRAPEWRREERPDFLNAKKSRLQAKHSMGWKSRPKGKK